MNPQQSEAMNLKQPQRFARNAFPAHLRLYDYANFSPVVPGVECAKVDDSQCPPVLMAYHQPQLAVGKHIIL